VRRNTIRWRPFQGHRMLGMDEREVMGFPKLRIFNAALLGAIVVTVVTLAELSNPESVKKLAPSEVARGDPGVLVCSFALSPTIAQIATTDDAGRVTLRAQEKVWQFKRFLDFPGYAAAVAFSPDGRSLAAVGAANCVCLWDLKSRTSHPASAVAVPIQWPNRTLFSPDGHSLVITTAFDGTILVWDLATQRERMVLHHHSPVATMAFSPDGLWLATAGTNDRSILLWELHSGFRRVLSEGASGGHTAALAFSPDGALLASVGFFERHVRLWDLKTGRVCRTFEGHARSVTSVTFSPDGSLLATAGNDGMLGLWTVPMGQRLVSFDGEAMWFRAVAFSPDGRTLVVASGTDDDIRRWDIAELLRAPPGRNFSPMKTGSIKLTHRF
jgi:WD40 repeat protein